jgi:hypothetical protein
MVLFFSQYVDVKGGYASAKMFGGSSLYMRLFAIDKLIGLADLQGVCDLHEATSSYPCCTSRPLSPLLLSSPEHESSPSILAHLQALIAKEALVAKYARISARTLSYYCSQLASARHKKLSINLMGTLCNKVVPRFVKHSCSLGDHGPMKTVT